jgi:hypothetical protein
VGGRCPLTHPSSWAGGGPQPVWRRAGTRRPRRERMSRRMLRHVYPCARLPLPHPHPHPHRRWCVSNCSLRLSGHTSSASRCQRPQRRRRRRRSSHPSPRWPPLPHPPPHRCRFRLRPSGVGCVRRRHWWIASCGRRSALRTGATSRIGCQTPTCSRPSTPAYHCTRWRRPSAPRCLRMCASRAATASTATASSPCGSPGRGNG